MRGRRSDLRHAYGYFSANSLANRRSKPDAEPVVGLFDSRVGRSRPARVGVAAGIDDGDLAQLIGAWGVRMSEDDHVSLFLSGQKRQRSPVVVVAVDHEKATVERVDGGDGGQARTDRTAVAVAMDGDEPIGVASKIIQHRRSREVAGVEDTLGRRESLLEMGSESRVVTAMGVRKGEEHTVTACSGTNNPPST